MIAAGIPNKNPPILARLSMKGRVPTASKNTSIPVSFNTSSHARSTICHDWNSSTNRTLRRPKTDGEAPPLI